MPLPTETAQQQQFLEEVLRDLSSEPKRLSSKYFYDAAGDALFQQIMACPEYYLTRCETEIFDTNASGIAALLDVHDGPFDLIELGAGDGSKTVKLLDAFQQLKSDFTYIPIDISSSIIQFLKENLAQQMPALKVQGMNGEYLDMLNQIHDRSTHRKVVLFLGSTIGNMTPNAALNLCREMRQRLDPGDRILIGFDLKKHPAMILAAYDDVQGFTREFNLNLLRRINRELDGNFAVEQFDHYPCYDPLSGACMSFLVSRVNQHVQIADSDFHFKMNEVIHMEISQKYSPDQVRKMAADAGFRPVADFMDARNWFLDAVWECI
jgi:dimethylhistidine N-methyltransferase